MRKIETILQKYKYNSFPLEKTMDALAEELGEDYLDQSFKDALANILIKYKWDGIERKIIIDDIEKAFKDRSNKLDFEEEFLDPDVFNLNLKKTTAPILPRDLKKVVDLLKGRDILAPECYFKLVHEYKTIPGSFSISNKIVDNYKLFGSKSGLITNNHSPLELIIDFFPAKSLDVIRETADILEKEINKKIKNLKVSIQFTFGANTGGLPTLITRKSSKYSNIETLVEILK